MSTQGMKVFGMTATVRGVGEPDPNWLSDRADKSVPAGVQPILRYFERAALAFQQVARADTPPSFRAEFTAFCSHACQSLQEALWALDKAENGSDSTLKPAIETLSFAALIKDIRDHDIHGCPIPVCSSFGETSFVMSREGSPIQLSSEPGGWIQVQMDGAKPVVSKNGGEANSKLNPGQTISYHGVDGVLHVWDYRTGKSYTLQEVLDGFLTGAKQLIEGLAERREITLTSTPEPPAAGAPIDER